MVGKIEVLYRLCCNLSQGVPQAGGGWIDLGSENFFEAEGTS
jgi:hypothetical protein